MYTANLYFSKYEQQLLKVTNNLTYKYLSSNFGKYPVRLSDYNMAENFQKSKRNDGKMDFGIKHV